MLTARPFANTARVELVDRPASVPAHVASEIERLWRVAQVGRDEPLFNGRIVSAVDAEPGGIRAVIVEYKQWIAQLLSPDLFDVLRVRPLSVSGVLECADGLVFGKRSGRVTQAPGCWELAPSGGLDPDRSNGGPLLDPQAQLLSEMTEELGIPASGVIFARTFCTIDDSESHTLDMGILLNTGLRADGIRRLQRELPKPEYDEICIVGQGDLERFIAGNGSAVMETSQVLLRQLGRLPTP